MTTLLYDRRIKGIAVDSKNTDSGGQVFITNKIERLDDGSFFLGSGHLLGIGKAKRWANKGFLEKHRPEFGYLISDPDEYGFSCIVISEDGMTVTMIDDELEPYEVLDELVATGSGGASARAARAAGATLHEAVEIAIKYDSNSGGPVRVHHIGDTYVE